MTRSHEPSSWTVAPGPKLPCYTTGLSPAGAAKVAALFVERFPQFAAPVADASHIVGAPATEHAGNDPAVRNEAGAANHPPEQK